MYFGLMKAGVPVSLVAVVVRKQLARLMMLLPIIREDLDLGILNAIETDSYRRGS